MVKENKKQREDILKKYISGFKVWFKNSTDKKYLYGALIAYIIRYLPIFSVESKSFSMIDASQLFEIVKPMFNLLGKSLPWQYYVSVYGNLLLLYGGIVSILYFLYINLYLNIE